LRVLLAKAAVEDFEINYIDINTTFLNAIINKDVYIEVPEYIDSVYPELKSMKYVYLKLNKTLYGLKQSLIE
jgi:hypothetical protein